MILMCSAATAKAMLQCCAKQKGCDDLLSYFDVCLDTCGTCNFEFAAFFAQLRQLFVLHLQSMHQSQGWYLPTNLHAYQLLLLVFAQYTCTAVSCRTCEKLHKKLLYRREFAPQGSFTMDLKKNPIKAKLIWRSTHSWASSEARWESQMVAHITYNLRPIPHRKYSKNQGLRDSIQMFRRVSTYWG